MTVAAEERKVCSNQSAKCEKRQLCERGESVHTSSQPHLLQKLTNRENKNGLRWLMSPMEDKCRIKLYLYYHSTAYI